ncbi:uncharacterized protein [Euphorbia lathyris]|uniref:uncharacterized protein n=1 Tax=Euphorbia lathyris TaxID=212925 RepID=UPI003313F714
MIDMHITCVAKALASTEEVSHQYTSFARNCVRLEMRLHGTQQDLGASTLGVPELDATEQSFLAFAHQVEKLERELGQAHASADLVQELKKVEALADVAAASASRAWKAARARE